MLKKLTYDQVCELEGTINHSECIYSQVKALWLAMTDWPRSLENTDDFIIILSQDIQGDLSKENLINYLDKLNRNLGSNGNAWKSETIVNLIELFQYYPNAKLLDEVIYEIIEKTNY